jgi:hypothetical protein
VHLDFILPGPPVSYQTRESATLRAWQKLVRTEAGKLWKKPPLTGKLKFLLINFHDRDKPPMDDDNMVKPIRDALNHLVYEDDRQIRYSETIQVSMDDPILIRGGAFIILTAFSKNEQFLYVRIEDAPTFIQLPR